MKRLAIVLAAAVVAAAAPAANAAEGNAVTRWTERALEAVRSGNPAVHTGTPGASRTYAMTTAAMYDAVNGIDTAAGASTRGRAVIGSYAAAPAGADRNAAAAAAAHAVLTSVFASNAAVKGRLDEALAAEPADAAGRAWGAQVGQEVLAARAADGTETAQSQPGGSGAGLFPRTFSGAQFRHMAPFGIASTAPYRSAGPPPLDSAEYADSLNEVKALGSLSDTDPERAAHARHWLAEGGTVRETGLWFKAALVVADQQGTTASVSDSARLFALLGMGVADAVATSWSDKYAWRYWRPGDAIRQADIDGNPATAADPAWNPRGGACAMTNPVSACPTFGGTPEHTSGTATFAGAAAAVLAGFYCRDDVRFAFTGEQPGSAPRWFDGFAQAARDAGRSRIFGGIHFQFSNDAGREAGKEIGREISRTRLLPTGGGSCRGR